MYKLSDLFKISILILVAISSGCSQQNNEIRRAVEEQLKEYPESRLQDLYKSFFQDEFGPGHMIDDIAFAREYFDLELEDMVSRGRHNAESCGLGNNFVRVPMDLVKDGLIKDEDFFKAFMDSSLDFKVPDKLAWRKKWGLIEKEIERMGLQIPDLEKDNKAILRMIDLGEPAIHHSDGYNKAYDPHYRIMGKKQWEELAKKH
jgi:hypothetical protein